MILIEADRRTPEGRLRREYIEATQELLSRHEVSRRDAEVYLVSD